MAMESLPGDSRDLTLFDADQHARRVDVGHLSATTSETRNPTPQAVPRAALYWDGVRLRAAASPPRCSAPVAACAASGRRPACSGFIWFDSHAGEWTKECGTPVSDALHLTRAKSEVQCKRTIPGGSERYTASCTAIVRPTRTAGEGAGSMHALLLLLARCRRHLAQLVYKVGAPSPVRLITRPLCTAMVGSIRLLRKARNLASVRSSSSLASRGGGKPDFNGRYEAHCGPTEREGCGISAFLG